MTTRHIKSFGEWLCKSERTQQHNPCATPERANERRAPARRSPLNRTEHKTLSGRLPFSIKLAAAITLCAGIWLLVGTAAYASPARLKFRETIKGSFTYLESVTVDKATGDLYVADTINNRIQKLGPNGEPILMWGREVNKTKTEAVKVLKKNGGTPTPKEIEEENVCTHEEEKGGVECKEGSASGEAGGMSYPQSVTVDNTCVEQKLTEPTCKEKDSANGNVYVLDIRNHRVDEFGPEGQFVLMFGGEVNKNGTNVCTVTEYPECKAGRVGAANGFFEIWQQFEGNMLAVGGPEHLVYVADEGRVQEFDHTGKYMTQLTLTTTTPVVTPVKKEIVSGKEVTVVGQVTGLTVDPAGNLYVTASRSDFHNSTVETPNGIYEFAPGNTKAVEEINTTDGEIEGLALDGKGHLAFTDSKPEGTLFDLTHSEPPSKFGQEGMSKETTGLAFNAAGTRLYTADIPNQYIELYEAIVGPELQTNGYSCQEGTPVEASATVDCTLNGTINPEGVPNTQAWFRWGTTTQLEHETPKQKISTSSTPLQVSTNVMGLAPNQPIYYELAASDEAFGPPQTLASSVASFTTPTTPPRIVGSLGASFVKPSSAVLTGNVNPENTNTEYFVEYATGEALAHCLDGIRKEACSGVHSTKTLESSEYQTVGATFEVSGLQPSTTYAYRLNAINEKEQVAVSERGTGNPPEGQFTTAPAVQPQASTGTASNITATSATVLGQVNPDGELASYAFELGVYAGANTQYGIVRSGTAGEETVPVNETLQLSGLQPDTTYAFRIKIESAYGIAYGLTATFTTQGVPAVLPPAPEQSAVGMLPVPKIRLPQEPPAQKKPLTRAQELHRGLKACKHKRSKAQRVICERNARKRYGSKTSRKKHGKRK